MTVEEHDALRDAARRLLHKELDELGRARDLVEAVREDVHRLAVGLIEIAAAHDLSDALDDVIDLYTRRDQSLWRGAEIVGHA